MDGAGQGMPYYLFHYTYGIEYSKEGLPVELQVSGWPGVRVRVRVRVGVRVRVRVGVGVEVAVGVGVSGLPGYHPIGGATRIAAGGLKGQGWS